MSAYKHIAIQIFRILTRKQRRSFIGIAILLVGAAFFAQITPLAIGYLTDSVLTTGNVIFTDVLPVLLLVLAVNLAGEGMKVTRRLMIEDTATATEKNARQRASESLLRAPLWYFRQNLTGNIHGRLNRSIEGTIKLVKLMFMEFAPAVFSCIAAIIVIFLSSHFF